MQMGKKAKFNLELHQDHALMH